MPSDCIFCKKECKTSDSRPFPNLKSKESIHNKCLIKKNLTKKNQTSSDTTPKPTNDQTNNISSKVASQVDKIKREEDLKKVIEGRQKSRMIEERIAQQQKEDEKSSQFFFDTKAGIAKPHEKRQYLNHRNIGEMTARYDDNGFQEETVGRSYDHTGKDLDTLGDDDDDNVEGETEAVAKSAAADNKVHFERGHKRRHPDHNEAKESRKTNRMKVDEQNPCWFCLSSPNVEKHLIIAIGEYCYLTLAKGGLSDDHLLILPIEHFQSLNSDENIPELLQELEDFKKSLVSYFNGQSKGVIFYERNFRSVHWQLQVVPIELERTTTVADLIKTVSKVYFKGTDYIDIPENCSISDIIPSKSPYFFWQIEPIGSRFVTPIQVRDSFFPIQFGRLVLADAKILNCEDKIDWKKCAKSKELYVDIVKKLKESYRHYDIT